MIKKQVGWQMDKFTFSHGQERQDYERIRAEIQAMQPNGWEVESVHVLGFDPTNSNATVLVNLVKYEWVDEEK